jgi:hypothetical protein
MEPWAREVIAKHLPMEDPSDVYSLVSWLGITK